MDRAERARAWAEDGFFVLRAAVPAAEARELEAEVVSRIREDPPERHPGERAYLSGENYYIVPEVAPSPAARNPEDRIAKVFNCHAEGLARQIAGRPALVDAVEEILGPDLDCFQSQFIFKNPGVVGQPWHQDSHYFKFDKQPQVGVWLALSRATLENGCLWVTPGSHRAMRIFEHVPDRRPEALQGYLEIVDQDTSRRIPVLMEPGDVLFFHSYLMHMSTDNVADDRRSAMVYHYGRAGTDVIASDRRESLARVNRWVPVRRAVAA
ncbi:phytanoyl-CoA dioxygenase family protein [Phenylobacterium terrae]|uniref:Phytanoyl-CoA dioxygenase family protein n=1 Tax=Phenylobacterium terrae TaxID=2665495 RepID=A0ABW4N6V6_9CAUL